MSMKPAVDQVLAHKKRLSLGFARRSVAEVSKRQIISNLLLTYANNDVYCNCKRHMPIKNRGETICQEETELAHGRGSGEQKRNKDVSAHQSMDNTPSMEADASVELDAGACKAVALAVVLRVYILRLRKKKRLNSSA